MLHRRYTSIAEEPERENNPNTEEGKRNGKPIIDTTSAINRQTLPPFAMKILLEPRHAKHGCILASRR